MNDNFISVTVRWRATSWVPGEKKPKWWREFQVSLLATFQSRPQKVDPLPEVPENLLDLLLQLCADKLSETGQMKSFWRQRAETQTGRRKSRATA